ncbi:hypothetical protein P7C71_g2539, partial [Lecanoromycetidae sp. Uapishka_2]
MLQGIFEPVAERKKGTLEKILSDFPERRFLLAGDSGEADLELYTDIVVANPGRILGVFIRDVTTNKPPAFFDSAMKPRASRSPLRGRSRDDSSDSPKRRSVKIEDKPPTLPPRHSSHSTKDLSSQADGPTLGKLIDYDDDEPTPGVNRSLTDSDMEEAGRRLSKTTIRSFTPSRPTKPAALRSTSNEHQAPSTSTPKDAVIRKAAPQPPPKPRQYSSSQENPNQPNEPSPLSQTQNASPPGSRATSLERQSYRAAVRNKVASAYNALPSLYGNNPPPQNSAPATDLSKSISRPPPPVPPRRNITSYPAAAAQYASNRISGGWSGYNNDGNSGPERTNESDPVLSKKEELWLRRWARAKEIFDERGVVLKSWRVGEDVADEAIRLVESARKEQSKR